MATGSGPQ